MGKAQLIRKKIWNSPKIIVLTKETSGENILGTCKNSIAVANPLKTEGSCKIFGGGSGPSILCSMCSDPAIS